MALLVTPSRHPPFVRFLGHPVNACMRIAVGAPTKAPPEVPQADRLETKWQRTRGVRRKIRGRKRKWKSSNTTT